MQGDLVRTAGLGLLAAVLSCIAAAPAWSAFPGQNGRIAFGQTVGATFQSDIRSIAADGSDVQTVAALNQWFSGAPAWSPDGTKIAFDRTFCDPKFGFCSSTQIWVTNASGGGEDELTTGNDGSLEPSWSPDGTRIAFQRSANPGYGVYVMNADGSNQTQLTNRVFDTSPAWSPDGTKIAFEGIGPDSQGVRDIFVVSAAGGTPQRLTNVAVPDVDPDWSPDGSKIVWARNHDIYVMNADGSGQTPVVTGQSNLEPVWSPQGDKIVFQRGTCPGGTCGDYDLWVVNPDGSGLAKLFGDEAREEFQPSWQPIPVNSYPRPASARTVRVSLVPAHQACHPGLATHTHGPPLEHPSCASPALSSSHLTLGTPDSNGVPANSSGHVRATVQGETPINPGNGDQADVRYEFQLTDVRTSVGLSDYTGELEARIDLRVTDRDNTPSPFPTGAATGVNTEISFTVPCAGTASTSVGATCTASTTADALVPGSIKEGKRAVWQLGQVRVRDGGADGDAQTTPNTLFAVQGVFIP